LEAWRKLAIITVNCRKLVKDDETGKWILREPDPSHARHYRLIGYVAMGRREGGTRDCEVFRSYPPDGRPIFRQVPVGGYNSIIVLGERERSYMLFYAQRTSDTDAVDHVFPEFHRDNIVTIKRWRRNRILSRIRMSRSTLIA
jgi:hypothetical protein